MERPESALINPSYKIKEVVPVKKYKKTYNMNEIKPSKMQAAAWSAPRARKSSSQLKVVRNQ